MNQKKVKKSLQTIDFISFFGFLKFYVLLSSITRQEAAGADCRFIAMRRESKWRTLYAAIYRISYLTDTDFYIYIDIYD